MDHNKYLSLSIAERTSHLELDELCLKGGPLTARQLGRILDVQGVGSSVPTAICGNPECSNPLHYAFLKAIGERRKLITAEQERRLRHLLLNTQFRHASTKSLASKAHCSRTVVRRVLLQLGLEDRQYIQTYDGHVVDPKKYNVKKTQTQPPEAR